ncbi:MAG TPA: ABC transporter permease [Gemmataceae bacterium]|nr:ABC transporter permease [Gemmataceae bacterium]
MQTSRAIKPKRDDTLLSNWESMPERAPSLETPDKPIVARILAMIGLFLFVLGALAVTYPLWRTGQAIIGFGWGFFFGSIGLCLILFHVFAERDFQFRRMYAFVGLALLLAGVVLRLMAFKSHMDWYVIGGIPALAVGLIVLIGVARNETDAGFRMLLLNIIGALAGLMIVFSIVQGLRDNEFLAGEGAVMMLLGLLYASAYIGLNDNPNYSYYAGLLLGGAGFFGFVGGLAKALTTTAAAYLVPSGIVLMGMSIVYVLIAIGICVDWPVVVLTRRELAAYFYSPLAYLVLIGQLIYGWIMFAFFVFTVEEAQGRIFEPILGNYIFSIIPVIVQMFFVPVLTMRLLSEERRSGTLEVLLTAPLGELSVVVAKFLAAWIFYNLLMQIPWLFLISMRFVGGEEFDYRPALSFSVAMAAISAGLLAMGLFMSSLTSNQIIAAVFAFVGVMAHLVIYMLKFQTFAGPFSEALTFVNYLDFMYDSLGGIIAPRYFVFHLSVAVFFLFATMKVLEARKWA